MNKNFAFGTPGGIEQVVGTNSGQVLDPPFPSLVDTIDEFFMFITFVSAV